MSKAINEHGMYEGSLMRIFRESNVPFYKISVVYNSWYKFLIINEKLFKIFLKSWLKYYLSNAYDFWCKITETKAAHVSLRIFVLISNTQKDLPIKNDTDNKLKNKVFWLYSPH